VVLGLDELTHRIFAGDLSTLLHGVQDFAPGAVVINVADDDVMADDDGWDHARLRQADPVVEPCQQAAVVHAPVDLEVAQAQGSILGLGRLQEGLGRL
jgi:hypothetical protein